MILPPENDANWNKEFGAAREDRFDASIRKVLADVVPPTGARERLLARLDAAPDLANSSTASPRETKSGDGSFPPPGSVILNRRNRWLWAVPSAAAIAATLLLAVYLSRPPVGLHVEDVLASGLSEFTDRREISGDTQLVAATPPENWFALPRDVLTAPRAQWREITFLGRSGVVYEFSSRLGVRGKLYVAPMKGRPHLPSLARRPLAVSRSTAGLSTTAWTDGQRLFVLVARGGKNDLSGFLRPAAPVV